MRNFFFKVQNMKNAETENVADASSLFCL